MFGVRERYDVLRSMWSPGATHITDEAEFDAWSRLRFDAYASVAALACIIISLALGVFATQQQLDLPGLDHAYARADMIAGPAGLAYLVIPRTAFVKRHIVAIFGLLICAGLYFAMGAFALLGSPDKPFVHLWYVVPLWTVGLPMRLRSRIVFDVALGGCLIAGLIAPDPSSFLDSPWAGQCYRQMFSSVALSIVLGQVVQLLYRRTFIQMQDAARTGRSTERARIARDLHDDLGQELEALRYAMALAQARYAEEPHAIGANLADLEEMLGRTSSSMRRVMSEMRPRLVEDLGFAAAAKWLATQISERSSLACEVEIVGPEERIDPDHRAAAFRILQEALTNVLKHAQAKRVQIRIAIGETALDVTITDDGTGLAPVMSDTDGMGLSNMRERARSLGGTVDVAPGERGGVEVRCRLPLGEARA